MDLRITRADFVDPRLAVLLQAHLDELAPTAPLESQHALDLDALDAPQVRLWVVHHGADLVGTGALCDIGPGHAELKSMRTQPALRGRGVGAAVLAHVLTDARERGLLRISLETGSSEFFAPARTLYARHRFVECPPFAGYAEDPHSTFMTLAL